MHRGFLYLVAIMDWATRKALAWRLSNTLEAEFCLVGLDQPVTASRGEDIHGWPGPLPRHIFVERLWRSLKNECVYLHAWSGGREARAGIGKWVKFYNQQRPHSSLGGQTPYAVYWNRNQTEQPEWPTRIVA